MMNWLRPRLRLARVQDITPELLAAHGIEAVLLDADNTLVPRSQYELDHEVAQWVAALQAAGHRLCILSNSHKVGQVAAMGALHDMASISLAKKPFATGFRKAMALCGSRPETTAMVGDQLLTDIVGGNRQGLLTIMVDPLTGRDFILYSLLRPFERRLLRRWQSLEEALEQAAEQEVADA